MIQTLAVRKKLLKNQNIVEKLRKGPHLNGIYAFKRFWIMNVAYVFNLKRKRL